MKSKLIQYLSIVVLIGGAFYYSSCAHRVKEHPFESGVLPAPKIPLSSQAEEAKPDSSGQEKIGEVKTGEKEEEKKAT